METYYKEGKVKALGISEFGMLRLNALIPHVAIRPVIDQINLRDCCDVPTDLLDFSMAAGIKLMPHMDEDDPLPKDTLQEVLGDLKVKETVDMMRWVVKYTAVVKQRGVIENKGYIVSFPVAHCQIRGFSSSCLNNYYGKTSEDMGWRIELMHQIV